MTEAAVTFLSSCRERTDTLLAQSLPDDANPLAEALRYSALGGGKRIRPCLVYAGAAACASNPDIITSGTDQVACAVELVHCYSLVHDDLPAMDDDELRRGRPTCHIAFDEATAILAGDALQALAYEQLTLIDDIPASQVVALVAYLAKASGANGMVLGQVLDLAATNRSVDLDYLETMHHRKTGDLISASVVMGAMTSGCSDESTLLALEDYGRAIGLAFQVRDDILDDQGDTATLGKTTGSDARQSKATYTSLLGLEHAQTLLEELRHQSLRALHNLDERADHLRAIANFIVERER